MGTTWTGSISFGLVYIPVALQTATSENNISFNQLHKKCGNRVNYKKVCSLCNQELRQEDIVRGFNYARDKYVTVSDDEIAKIKTPRDKSIEIECFVRMEDIDPIYYERSYYVLPTAGEKQYKLLLEALKKEGKIGIAKTVLGTKATLLALRAKDNLLIVSTLFYSEEIRQQPHIALNGEVKETEISLACTLIDNMSASFAPELYHDDYRARLEEAIQNKINGQEIVEQPPDFRFTNVIDLMDALKRSIAVTEQRKAEQPKSQSKPKPKVKATTAPTGIAPEMAAKRRPSHTRQQPHS